MSTVLCKASNELRDCLFFECEYPKNMWNRIKLLFNIGHLQHGNLLDIANVLSHNHGKGKQQQNIIDVCLVTTVWHIWYERSNRLFNK